MKEFIFNNWQYFLIVIIYAISFAITILKIIQSKKTNNNLIDDKIAVDELKSKINQFIIDAEKFTNYSGEEKKQFVITRALEISNKLLTSTQISDYIEEQVNLTDNVNKHNH